MLLTTLGDSLSCGEGVGLRVPLRQTWVGLLADALPGTQHLALAAPGARTSAVLEGQLPLALTARPDLATLVIGLNDVSRGAFDADAVAQDLRVVVDGLLAVGAHVLLGRLHDPTRLLALPAGLARRVRTRVDAVNAAVDACTDGRVAVLDLATVPMLRVRAGWAVDRLHPSVAGHAALARAAAQVLRHGGWVVRPVPFAADPARDPGRAAEAAWVVRHGLPYLASHTRELGRPLVALTAGRAG